MFGEIIIFSITACTLISISMPDLVVITSFAELSITMTMTLRRMLITPYIAAGIALARTVGVQLIAWNIMPRADVPLTMRIIPSIF